MKICLKGTCEKCHNYIRAKVQCQVTPPGTACCSSALTGSWDWWELFVIHEEILGPAFPEGD